MSRHLLAELDRIWQSRQILRTDYQRLQAAIAFWDVLTHEEQQALEQVFSHVRQGCLQVVDSFGSS